MIDEYLRELRPRLRGSWWHRRRVTAEVGEHLRDAAAALEAGGVPSDEAESRAIERFGSAESTARLLRQPWHRRRSVHALGTAAAIALAVLAVTRGATHDPRSVVITKPTGVQWISQTAPIPSTRFYVTPGPSNAPRCRAADLRHTVAGMQGATTRMVGGVGVINIGSHACTLRGFPTVRVLDTRSVVMTPRQVNDLSPGQPGQEPGWSAYPTVSLRPHQRAFVFFSWGNYCGTHVPGAVSVTVGSTAITASLAGSGGIGPTCLAASDPATLWITRWHPQDNPFQASPNRLPLRVTIHAPAWARAGRRIAYRVTLTNYSKAAVVLRPCPKYWQGVGSGARAITRVRRGLVLNCAAHRVMPAGASVTYIMRMRIPTNAERPDDTLVWALQPLGASAKATILIR